MKVRYFSFSKGWWVLIAAASVFFSFLGPDMAKPQKNGPVDYSSEGNWIALPWRKDLADSVPPGSGPERQSLAEVDVFYVHPTVYLSGGPWNASLDKQRVNERAEQCVLHQASAFNSSGKIYAPRYRQAHLKAFTQGGKQGVAALDTAYADIRNAFQYYLYHWNQGRPMVLVGHSQGAYHVFRLLHDFFEGKPLLQKLVAAYPVGFTCKFNEYRDIPVADSASQTGAYVTWNTVWWGTQPVGPYSRYLGTPCVNPLTWTRDEMPAPRQLHRGGLRFDFKKIDEELVETKINGPLLWIRSDAMKSATKYFHMGSNYHVSDINLFWMNIRENAELRCRTYLRSH